MKRYKKQIKQYMAFLAVLIILISIANTPAHALSQNGRQFGAGILAALLGINITLQSTLAPWQQLIDSVAEPINTAIEYTWPQTDWEDEILDRSQIQIWDEYIEIDGVKYTDIWLSTDAAQKFRTNAFDFATGYSIASNTNGTYASGAGYLDGVPLYLVNNKYQTQSYVVPSPQTTTQSDLGMMGDTTFIGKINSLQNYQTLGVRFSNGTSKGPWSNGLPGENQTWQWKQAFGNYYDAILTHNGTQNAHNQIEIPSALIDLTPFDFDWVSGTIPADTPLPSDTGMMIRVPSNTLDDFKEEHPDFVINAPIDIDFTLNPDLKVDIDDLFDVIAPVLANLNFGDVQFIENHETPAPVINNLLPDTYKQEIIQPITTVIENGTQQIIENIPTIQEICGNIDTAPINDLDTGVNRLPTLLLPYITDLRSALGIWHYVVSWVGQIGTTLTFVTSIIPAGIMTPIYACIAGFMCIKAYRRMTA